MLTVITPTCDRPAGVALLEKWMSRQTIKPDRWIVADGGQTPAPLTMGQERRWAPSPSGAANFAGNILRTLDGIGEGIVLVMEDDDWYSPSHIETCAKALKSADLYGCPLLRYWNVGIRGYMDTRQRSATLSQTAFRAGLVPRMRKAAEQAMAAKDYAIDGRFWGADEATGRPTSAGIKGLPGTKGLGVGHRQNRRWIPDPDKRKLREWIGKDADEY